MMIKMTTVILTTIVDCVWLEAQLQNYHISHIHIYYRLISC